MTDVIHLDAFRPKPEPPSPVGCSADWRLIDRVCDDLLLTENNAGQIRAALAGLLLACLDDEVASFAVTYWSFVKSVILAPLNAPMAGESAYQPMLDKLRGIDELVREFYRNARQPCPRYRPTQSIGV
jgi:hypothetical protein